MERRTFPEVPAARRVPADAKGRALMPLIEDMRQYGREWLGVGDDSCSVADDAAAEPAAAALA